MKILSLIVFLGALAFTAQAQHNSDPINLGGTAVNGGTNNVPALATNVYDVVAVTRGQNAAIQVAFSAPASSTSNLVVRVDTSVDGVDTGATNWLQNVYVFPIAAVGVARTTFVTNVNIGAIGYFRINLCNTNASGAITNVIAKVANKPGI